MTRWKWPGRRSDAERRERAPDMSTGTEALEAIERARESREEAVKHLAEMRILKTGIAHEIAVNHLAQDVHDSMRRRS